MTEQSAKQLLQDEVKKLGEQWKEAYEAFQEISEKYNEALFKLNVQ